MNRIFDAPLITNDQSIERVLAVSQPVLFVFLNGAASGPLEQSMNRLAREQAGKMLVVKVPVKDSPAATRRYQVGRFPAVVTVRGGQMLSKAEAVIPNWNSRPLFCWARAPDRSRSQPQPAALGPDQVAPPPLPTAGPAPLPMLPLSRRRCVPRSQCW